MADALAMVKVGNSECGFLKLTPLSRISAIAGAVCGVTFSARSPSGTNRTRLRGVLFWASAAAADTTIKPADRAATVRRIQGLPVRQDSVNQPLPLFSFTVRQNCYTRPACQAAAPVGDAIRRLDPALDPPSGCK